jgi:hypothetical protein
MKYKGIEYNAVLDEIGREKITSNGVKYIIYLPEGYTEKKDDKGNIVRKIYHQSGSVIRDGLPMVKKYINEFANEFGLSSNDLRYGNTLNQMRLIGREIAIKGIRQLPSLSKDFMFTEKFKRVIDYFISTYDLPDFVKVHLEETSPFRVRGWLTVDFEPAMKYDGNVKELHAFPREFTNLITSYLGYEIGSPAHGKIDFSFNSSVMFTGVEEWVKNVLNKKIKKEIKTLPSRGSLHSMKFNTNTNAIRGEISLIYTRDSWYSNQNNFKDEFKQYLENLGYNPMRLLVSSN